MGKPLPLLFFNSSNVYDTEKASERSTYHLMVGLRTPFAGVPQITGSMADIQSAAAEIRRGKIKKKKKEGRTNHSMKIYMVSLFHRATINYRPPLQISTGFASRQRYCTASSSGRLPNFAALNRGRHLCLAGRPSGWALAHILV